MTSTDLIDALNDLIETCKDSQYSFSVCGSQARSHDVQALLGPCAAAFSQAAAELQALVVQYGGEPETGGSLGGVAQRGWLTLRAGVTGHTDGDLLAECERGEEQVLTHYRRTLKEPLPTRVLALLERQQRELRQQHDTLRAARERLRVATGA